MCVLVFDRALGRSRQTSDHRGPSTKEVRPLSTNRSLTRTTRGLSRDFWTFWGGQAISNLGSSFTTLALPLLVYKLTGSAVNLALSSAAAFLPYLLFGLIIGAWVDRTDCSIRIFL